MHYSLVLGILVFVSIAQAAAPRQVPLPPQAPAIDPNCTSCDSCQCKPGECPSRCPVLTPVPPPAPPAGVRVCDTEGCRVLPAATASVGFASLAAAGQLANFGGGSSRGGPIRNFVKAVVNHVQQKSAQRQASRGK